MGLFDFFKKKKAVYDKDIILDDILLFDKLDEQIKKYNKLRGFLEKWPLFEEIHTQLVNLENDGKIRRAGKKPISYLKEIIEHDGPEYAYVIEFWPIWDEQRKYEIGVCVRGDPLIKKLNNT